MHSKFVLADSRNYYLMHELKILLFPVVKREFKQSGKTEPSETGAAIKIKQKNLNQIILEEVLIPVILRLKKY